MTGARNVNGHDFDPSALRLIDLFAGCGGLTCGFVESGHYRPIAAVENDMAAAATYAANFGESHVHAESIESWVTGRVPEADIVIGGPPCQGFSNLGARRSTDPRNSLWRRYVDTLVAARPLVFLLENVDRFATSSQFRALLKETSVRGRLRDYSIDMHVVQAADFGAAQRRRRTIVIGTNRDLPAIAVPRDHRSAQLWATVRDAIGDLTTDVDADHRDLPDSYVSAFGQWFPGTFKARDLHVTRYYTELSLARFRCIPVGGNRTDLPDELKAPCWLKHTTGSMDVMGRLHWDRPSVTIRTEFFKPEKGRYLHPEANRAITHHEAARIQGFPDSFVWCGSKLEIARQIGNAVPVPLARSLAEHIRAHLA